MTTTDLQTNLRQFSGGDDYYHHWTQRIVYTSGVKYLAEQAGAFWLIDLIASHQPKVLRKIKARKDRDFQVWRVEVKPDQTANVICDDGNGYVLQTQKLQYTDFPLEDFKLYVCDGVLMLPNEY